MCNPALAIPLLTTAATVGVTAYSANQQKKAQKASEAAMREQSDRMAKTQKDAQEAEARASRAPVNLAQIMSSNRAGGMASTLLTGTGGAPLSQMALGRNTLLGQ